MLYSVAALGACHVPDAETQACLNRQLSALRAVQCTPFVELVREYGECALRAREAEVRAGQLDKEAAELRDEVASLALRCAIAGGGGGGGGGGATAAADQSGGAAANSNNSNSAVAARALAARAEAYRADLQRARAELSAAYRERAGQLERAEEGRARERREMRAAAEAHEALSLAREEAAGLRARLLEASRELDGERAARDLAVREARARADARDRALEKAEALAADNADLVSRLVELRAAEGGRLEEIGRLHAEALDARRRAQADGAADRQLLGMLRRGVAGAAGAAGSALLGAAAAVAAGRAAGGPGSRRASQYQQQQPAGGAAAAASPTAAALGDHAQQQPIYYASLREKMGLPEARPQQPHAPERRLPRAPAAVGVAAAAHSGGLVALAWEPPPLTPAGGRGHALGHPHQHALGSGGGRHLATGGADRTVRIWDARAALAAAAAAAASASADGGGDGGSGAAGGGVAGSSSSSSFRRLPPPPPPAAALAPAATLAGGAIMGAVTDACYSCDGRRLVGAMGDARLLVWEAASGQLRHALTGHNGAVVAARCYPLDPGWCASAGEDRTLKAWDLARGTCARSVACGRTPNAMALAADGSGALITGHVDGSLCVWDFRQAGNRPAASSSSSSSSPVGEAKDHPGTILCVAPVGPVAGGGGFGGGGALSAGGGKHQQLPAGDAVAAAYGASGVSAVLTVCRDNAARVWDYRRMAVVCVLRAGGGGGGGFGGGGGGGFGGAALGGMGGGGAFCVGSMGGMGRGRCRAGVSPDGRFVAVGGSDGGVYVWDMAEVGRAAAAAAAGGGGGGGGRGGGEAAAAGVGVGGGGGGGASAPAAATVLRHHRDAVVAAAWSADGEVLATGDRGGHLALWRMEAEPAGAGGGGGAGGRRETS